MGWEGKQHEKVYHCLGGNFSREVSASVEQFRFGGEVSEPRRGRGKLLSTGEITRRKGKRKMFLRAFEVLRRGKREGPLKGGGGEETRF